MPKSTIEARQTKYTEDGHPAGKETVAVLQRTVQQASGWEWIWYNGKRYQVLGGIRGPEFINLDHPIEHA